MTNGIFHHAFWPVLLHYILVLWICGKNRVYNVPYFFLLFNFTLFFQKIFGFDFLLKY